MLPILFEDDHILAIHKPSGVPSHTLSTSEDVSCEAILKVERPGITSFLLHRLDTGTSGVLLFAKSEAVFDEMREKFKLKEIRKFYCAWSADSDAKTMLLKRLELPLRIDLPLAHHPKSKKRMMVIPPDKHRTYRGKPIPALSILRSASKSTFQNLKAIEMEVEIVTGVMHQIRVHLEWLGFPLIGDPIYLKSAEGKPDTRLALHAQRIEFELRGFRYEISAPSLLTSA